MANPNCCTDPRVAGQVRRYHTWPMNQTQTVAEHSWNVARILLAIWPDCPQHVLVQALLHDIGEAVSGDAPYPVKRDNPRLKVEMDRIEHDAHMAMCIPWNVPAPCTLSEVPRRAMKLADMLDLWEHCVQEMCMGNRLAGLGVQNGIRFATEEIRAMRESESRVLQSIAKNADYYIARRNREWEGCT